jgi:polyhydroxyalkanoate synthase
VVHEEGTLRLLHYRSERPAEFTEPVLICFALVNRAYVLDLSPQRSVVRRLLEHGLDVYLIDWGVPTAEDRTLRLADYVCGRLKRAVDCVSERSGAPAINLLGYCMGGTMSAIFTSLYPHKVRNLVLLAAPIDFADQTSLLNVWADEKYFDADALVDAYGNCPGWFLRAVFKMIKPVQFFYEKYAGLHDKLHDEQFVEHFFAMERWESDSIPVAGETFREFVKMLYQQNRLVKGELVLDEARVELQNIACPTLLLTAEQDHLVPPASTLAFKHYADRANIREMSIDAGHVGLVVSSKAHRGLWPAAASWIAEHSTGGGS